MGRTKGKPAMRNESVDSLIPKGLTLKVMARRSNYTGKEGVWDYLNRTKQLEDWHRSRSKPSDLCHVSLLIGAVGSRIADNIAKIIQGVQIRAYNDASYDERRAFDYLQSKPRPTYKWTGPLHRYFVAKKRGEAKTSADLCEDSVSKKGLYRVLGLLGLKSLGRPGRVPRERTPDLDVVDSYRLESRIYSIMDEGCGFSAEEIAEYLCVGVEEVEKAIKKRGEIEPIIIRALRAVYRRRRIDRPYLHPI